MHPLRTAALAAALCASVAAGTAAKAQTSDPNAAPTATPAAASSDTLARGPVDNRALFVMLGPTAPVGTINAYAKSGFGISAGAVWRSLASPIGFRGEGHFHSMAIDAPAGSRNVTASGTHRMLGALGSLLLQFGVDTSTVITFRPYVTGGLGLFNVSGDPTNRTTGPGSSQTFGDNTGTKFAFAVGGGARMNLFGFPALLEARVLTIRTPTPTTMLPIGLALEF